MIQTNFDFDVLVLILINLYNGTHAYDLKKSVIPPKEICQQHHLVLEWLIFSLYRKFNVDIFFR